MEEVYEYAEQKNMVCVMDIGRVEMESYQPEALASGDLAPSEYEVGRLPCTRSAKRRGGADGRRSAAVESSECMV